MILAANVRKCCPSLYLSLTWGCTVFLSSLEERESQLSGEGGAVTGTMGKETRFENDGLLPLSPHTPSSEHLGPVIIILARVREGSLFPLTRTWVESLGRPIQGRHIRLCPHRGLTDVWMSTPSLLWPKVQLESQWQRKEDRSFHCHWVGLNLQTSLEY